MATYNPSTIENHMVIGDYYPPVKEEEPPELCFFCGGRYEYERGGFDYACPSCVRRISRKAKDLLSQHLTSDEYGVIEDLWELCCSTK